MLYHIMTITEILLWCMISEFIVKIVDAYYIAAACPSNKYLVVQIENDRVCGVMNGSFYRQHTYSHKNAYLL